MKTMERFDPTLAQAKVLDLLSKHNGIDILFGGGTGCGKTELGRAAIWQADGPAGLIVSSQHQARAAREVFDSVPSVHIVTVDRVETLWASDLSLVVIDELIGWNFGLFANTRRRLRSGKMQLLVTASPLPVPRGKTDPIWWIRGPEPIPESEGSVPIRLGYWAPWLWPGHVADAKPGELLNIDGRLVTYIAANPHLPLSVSDALANLPDDLRAMYLAGEWS